MDNSYILLGIAFFVFFVSAYAGRKSALAFMSEKIKETKKWCTDEKEKVYSEIANEKSLIAREKSELARKQETLNNITTNLTAIPYMARIVADYDTRGLEILASSLDWGSDAKRLKKVRSLREIRAETKLAIAESKEAEYKLAYALEMFPALEDFLDTEFDKAPVISISDLSSSEHDHVRDYLEKDEYQRLTTAERNQLALDRYVASHQKTKWQIGRDYELYVGYMYSKKGYSVDYYGAYQGLEDLGRDLIAKNDEHTLIIQCKYWGAEKVIREKHIAQLYGTSMCYCYENEVPKEVVKPVLVTNITVSETAKKFAEYLNVTVCENFSIGSFPRIKCNVNRDAYGSVTKIYHLPFDQQYDSCKICNPGEFFAFTVAEAEAAGFRRAYRWHSNNA